MVSEFFVELIALVCIFLSFFFLFSCLVQRSHCRSQVPRFVAPTQQWGSVRLIQFQQPATLIANNNKGYGSNHLQAVWPIGVLEFVQTTLDELMAWLSGFSGSAIVFVPGWPVLFPASNQRVSSRGRSVDLPHSGKRQSSNQVSKTPIYHSISAKYVDNGLKHYAFCCQPEDRAVALVSKGNVCRCRNVELHFTPISLESATWREAPVQTVRRQKIASHGNNVVMVRGYISASPLTRVSCVKAHLQTTVSWNHDRIKKTQSL